MTDPHQRRDDIAAVTVIVRMVDGSGWQADLHRDHAQMTVDMAMPHDEPDITALGPRVRDVNRANQVDIHICGRQRPEGQHLRFTQLDPEQEAT